MEVLAHMKAALRHNKHVQKARLTPELLEARVQLHLILEFEGGETQRIVLDGPTTRELAFQLKKAGEALVGDPK